MLIADGGGGYGGTDWMAMDVIQMWQAIQNQDTTAHYQLLDGWRKSYELTLEHLGQVQNYRQNLAEAWPPEKSAASAAYLQRLDELIANLQSTYDAAVATHHAFASATLAISLSRNDVEKIYTEYTSNQTKLEEFKNRPYVAAGKSAVPPQKPPVADGRQEQLNNQARSIMYGLSSEIIQAKTQITKPPVYVPSGGREKGDVDNGDNTYVAPPIPPVTTFDPGSPSHVSSSGTTQHSTTHATNPGANPPAPPPSSARQPGLILGGIQPTPIAPPPTAGIIPQPPIGGGLPNVISPTPILPPTPIGSGSANLPPGAGMTKGFVGDGRGRPGMRGVPDGGMRAMAPGGVIGGTPGVGLGQPATGARPASRVNPVGGVINPNNSEGRPGSAGRGLTSGQPLGNLGRGSSGHRDESDAALYWDPDNPWETAEGVSPVVRPADEQRVDPGPAIGLH
jgi:hypothetical protein